MLNKESDKHTAAEDQVALDSVRLPSLRAMEAFICVARLGSLKAASERLHVTMSAVSRRIQTLEEELGVALFERGANGMRLSVLGKSYVELTSPAIDQLLDATRRLHLERDHVPIRISVGSAFENHWLTPRLSRFLAENAHVQVQLATTNDARVKVLDVDCSIWFGPGGTELPYSEEVVQIQRFPVCHPELVNSGALRTPTDLQNHVLIDLITAPEAWSAWLKTVHLADLRPRARMLVDNLDSGLHAAARGLGVVLGFEYLVDHHLDRGELVIPFAEERADMSTIYLILNPTSVARPVVQAFRRWFLRVARDEIVSGPPFKDASRAGSTIGVRGTPPLSADHRLTSSL